MTKLTLAYFISPHGFGHAARACAVMAALQNIESSIHFEIFTKVPRWFFERSLDGSFNYHDLLTDVGVVQKDSLTEDLPATIRQLDKMKSFIARHRENLAQQISELGCYLALCDIAPLGLVAAQTAGVPGVLIENFTWDWIYQGYEPHEPRFDSFITYLQDIFLMAGYHIQTEPICEPKKVNLVTGPVSRKPRMPAPKIREKLGVPDQTRLVLITMGGVQFAYTFLTELERTDGVHFVVPGPGKTWERRGNLVLLPPHSEFYHPDLVNACDVIIGKVGYSTLAESYQAGIPFGYVARSKFRESEPLMAYIDAHMNSRRITETQFLTGDWLSTLPELLAMPRLRCDGPNGADQAANFIVGLLKDKE